MDAVLNLLTRYQIPDPAAGLEVGQFRNPELQQLYTDLVQRGSASVVEALKVGATIEDLDIQDLLELSQLEMGADVARTLSNLLNGSKNHLRAFVQALQYYGETYTPQFMDPALYDEIINSGSTRGNGMSQSGDCTEPGTGQGQGQGQGMGQGQGQGGGKGSGQGGGQGRGQGQGGGRR